MRRTGKYLWFKDIFLGTQDKIERIMFRVLTAIHSTYYHRKVWVIWKISDSLAVSGPMRICRRIGYVCRRFSVVAFGSEKKEPVNIYGNA